MSISYRPIGIIRSPHDTIAGMPIQPSGAADIRGRIELDPELVRGLQDLAGFSHVILLYHFHRVTESRLTATPFMDDRPHGIFATRAPKRPNPIGLSVVRLLAVEDTTLHVAGVDILDGTPLLDIKPFVPEFDSPPADRCGWLEKARGRVRTQRSDDRFG